MIIFTVVIFFLFSLKVPPVAPAAALGGPGGLARHFMALANVYSGTVLLGSCCSEELVIDIFLEQTYPQGLVPLGYD